MGGQKDPRYLTEGHLLGFVAEAGSGPRAVRAQLLELCDRLPVEIGPLAESFRDTDRTAIVEKILRIAEQRMLQARVLVA
jgi:hypothetical protein